LKRCSHILTDGYTVQSMTNLITLKVGKRVIITGDHISDKEAEEINADRKIEVTTKSY